ncbi:hypothetical protein LCGC14_2842610, partial [marine sediment metagenome]
MIWGWVENGGGNHSNKKRIGALSAYPAPQVRGTATKKREDCMMSELLNRITTFYKRSVQ